MKAVAFITEHAVVDRIIDHLKLTFASAKPPPSRVIEQVVLLAAEENVDYFDHLIFIGRDSLSSFSRCEKVFCPNMLFRCSLLRRLTSPRARKYLTSMVKGGDSSPRAEIHRAAEKGISYNF
jgi:hypothetical protein